MATARPTVIAVLALLALVPAVVFLLNRSAMVVVLSLVSVGIIAASLYWMFGPTDGHGDEGSPVVE